MRNRLRMTLSALAALGLTACAGGGGSGGGTSTPPATPSNQAPSLTSGTSATVAENVIGTVYTAAASDPDGDTLTYSLSGTDASDLTLDASNGAVAFSASPDFEVPRDADANNIYEVTLTVSDGNGGQDSLTLTITVTNQNDTGQRYLEEVFSSVSVQRNVSFAPGLVMDIFTPAGDTATDRPVMIAASGGGFVSQDRAEMEPIAEAFARRGLSPRRLTIASSAGLRRTRTSLPSRAFKRRTTCSLQFASCAPMPKARTRSVSARTPYLSAAPQRAA